MPFYLWSLTASSNGTADPTINFAEGQAPSSLNDSDRALMARLVELVRDISGRIVTTGTSTAYAVTSNQVFDTFAHMDGSMIAFVPHTANGATVTLNVDGLGAKALRYGPSLELQTGMLISGTPYVATFSNADSAWYLQGFSQPTGIPLGGMIPYTASTAPNSAFVIPIGQAISRTTYATYFSLVSTGFGTGDGSTTFNVPDLRGRTVFGQESGGSGRITVAGGNFDGTVLGQTGGAQNKVIANANLPADIPVTDPGHIHPLPGKIGVDAVSNFATTGVQTAPHNDGGSSTSSAVTGISVNHGSANTAFPFVPPAIVLPYILRVI